MTLGHPCTSPILVTMVMSFLLKIGLKVSFIDAPQERELEVSTPAFML